MFATLCPHCRSRLTAVDNLVGHTMLCPLCHRPFVATPTPAVPPQTQTQPDMPVTARARRSRWSPLQIILTVVIILVGLIVSVPLLICAGLNNRVQQHRNEIAKEQEELNQAARRAFVEHGYTSVRLNGVPTRHALGYQAHAVALDKWARKHRLSMIFSYDANFIEVLMLEEDGDIKATSAAYEQSTKEQ